MNKNAQQSLPKDLIQAPAYPHTGSDIFTGLRTGLTDVASFEPSLAWLARITGQHTSKLHYWLHIFRHPHLISFFCLLERLPERKRLEFLSKYCRELPSLNSERLAHDPLAVSSLECLLREPPALTLIGGGNDFQRTFVLTAMGHRFQQLGKRNLVAGLDLHEPRKYVPIDSVLYAQEPLQLAAIKAGISEAWPSIENSGAGLFLFNGVWSIAPSLHAKILDLAQTRHVIVADNPVCDLQKAAVSLRGGSVRAITVGTTPEHAHWIRIKVDSL